MSDQVLLLYTPDLGGAREMWTLTDPDMGPVVTCGNGHIAGIPDHKIDAHGTISPSLQCPEDGCDWHVSARLDGWDG